ncbi:exoribonuclease II [Microdochium nivale]|nr:exoribonuclease II [Microdochium nivale]
MLQASKRSFVCWRCAVRTSSLESSTIPRTTTGGSAADSFRAQMQARRGMATVRHSTGLSNAAARALAGMPDEVKRVPIRIRLRAWEKENPGQVQAMLTDHAAEGEASNTYTRPQNITMAQFEITKPLFDGDELSDLRSDDALLQAGDLVELSSGGSRRPALAICLGKFNGYEHYYTSSGKWFYGMGVKTLFVVNRFATPEEIRPILEAILIEDAPLEMLNSLQDLRYGPQRETGAVLLHKMLSFVQASEKIYQDNAGTLDASSAFIGAEHKHKYLTLHEIADKLLPMDLRSKGHFLPEALYAVHGALLQSETFFRPLMAVGHRRSYIFEVSPLSEVRVVQRVEQMVREYIQIAAVTGNATHELRKKGTPPSLASFARSARETIDRSRRARSAAAAGGITASDVPSTKWSETDREFLSYISLWCAYRKFPHHSRLQALGSAVLKAVDRYPDTELLNASTGWKFLQEVGYISPYDIPARYTTRFPDVEIDPKGGYIRPIPEGSLDQHLQEDIFAGTRKEWNGVTAFCIDADTTVDIDDAVSVEKTDKPGEFWVHAHIADPASRISADTPVAKYAELLPQTIYLPGNFTRMLPEEIGRENFSLAADRPCLTISALVDESGQILNTEITPGILKDVVYMNGETVARALGEVRDEPVISTDELVIGSGHQYTPVANRTITQQPSAAQLDDLKLLSRLGKSLQEQRLSRGATPLFQPRAEVDAYFDEAQQAGGSTMASGDPSIRISYKHRTDTDIVENVMKLAGEVAARWCHDRGVPIPYRTQPHAARNWKELAQYTKDVFYPLLRQGVRPSSEQWRHLRSLIGVDELTTNANPHWTLGVDLYTKATSPLRRYSDLIVHWQIEAALLEERRRGQSLLGNKGDTSFLPFNRAQLDRALPMVRLRERQARALTNGDGGDQWMLYALVRAWKGGEASLPATFRLTVEHVLGRQSVSGKLDWFERSAVLRAEALNGVARIVDVRVGDVLTVKLQSVSVHANQVLVEAVDVVKGRRGTAAAVTVADAKASGSSSQSAPAV